MSPKKDPGRVTGAERRPHTRVHTCPHATELGGGLGPPTLLGWDYANESPFKSSRPCVPVPGSARTRVGGEDGRTMRVQGALAILGTLLVLGAAQRRKWVWGGRD